MPTLLNAETLWSLARVSTPLVARDGSFCIISVRRTDAETQQNTTQIYRVARGEEPFALTAANTSSGDPALSHDSQWLAFVRRPLGAPNDRAAQLHVMALARGGEPRIIGDFPLGVSEPRFFNDGKRVCVVANVYADSPTLEGTRAIREQRSKSKHEAHVTEDRVYRFWDRWLTDGEVPHLFEVSLIDGAIRDLTPSLTAWFDLMGDGGNYDISPESTEIVFAAYMHEEQHQRVRSAIYTLSLTDGAIRCLTGDHRGDDVRPSYSPDGRYILYGARRDHTHCSHFELRLRSREDDRETTLAPKFEYDADEWSFADANTLVGSATIRGRSRPWTLSLASNTITVLDTGGGSVHGVRAAANDQTLWFTHDSLTRPPEVHSMPLGGGALTARTHFNDAILADVAFARVEERTIPGADKHPVQVFVLHPHPLSYGETRHKTLVHLLHGGPFGMFGDTWSWRWNAQIFAARGHSVAMVNFHGSNSFGEDFAKSVLGDWGGKPARDVMAVTDVLVAEGLADDNHVAIAGGSFGGYLTAWLTSQTSRFRCAIAHAPVTDVLAMLASDFTLEWNIEMGAWPWDGPEAQQRFARFDPMRSVANVNTPTLVIHGALDYRVPYDQSLAWYGALKARGVPSRLVVYPSENHWILQRPNSIHWFREMLSWLDRWLIAA